MKFSIAASLVVLSSSLFMLPSFAIPIDTQGRSQGLGLEVRGLVNSDATVYARTLPSEPTDSQVELADSLGRHGNDEETPPPKKPGKTLMQKVASGAGHIAAGLAIAARSGGLQTRDFSYSEGVIDDMD